jgi:hypothetical protein
MDQDAQDPRAANGEDAASVLEGPCPFCGWDPAYEESDDFPRHSCEHLVTEWAGDVSDNGGGVLGESLFECEGPVEAASDLGIAAWTLCEWAYRNGEEQVPGRLKLAAKAMTGEPPSWWGDLRETIDEWRDSSIFADWDPDPELSEFGGDNPYVDDAEDLGRDFANPMTLAVARRVPGITLTWRIIGEMTSGSSILVFADDRAAGWAALNGAVAAANRTIEAVIAELDAHQT